MNITASGYNQNFCANPNIKNLCGVNVRITPHITRLTGIADLKIEGNKAIAYNRHGDILSTNYDNIMTSLREAATELSWTHKYNSARGIWSRR